MTSLGKRFRQWRAERGLLLLEAATLMGLGISQLSEFEHGDKPWPVDVAERVERLLRLRGNR